MNRLLDNILRKNRGIVTTDDVLRAGFSGMMLTKLVKDGELERVAHGVYVRSGEIVDELYVLQKRSERIVFSHETALWFNGLSDRAPLEYHVTIPTGAPLGSRLREACRCHYVKSELFELGLETRKTVYGNEVRCYNAERTICDMVRNESKVGVEAFVGGLRAYAASRQKDVVGLMAIAARFGVDDVLSKYMGILI